MLKTLLPLSFLVGCMFGGMVVHLFDTPIFNYEEHINYQKLPFPETNANVYMNARALGLTGDSETVRFCAAPIDIKKPLEANGCVVLYTNEAYYRRERPNILHIYAGSGSIPEDQPDRLGPITVQIHEIKSFDQFKELEKSYEQQGIGIINIPY